MPIKPSFVDLTVTPPPPHESPILIDLTGDENSNATSVNHGVSDVATGALQENKDCLRRPYQNWTISPKSHGKNRDTPLVSCRVCLDEYAVINQTARKLMVTNCGHIFCNLCIETATKTRLHCPVCRKKMSKRSIHQIFL